jgi:hypothetical protein
MDRMRWDTVTARIWTMSARRKEGTNHGVIQRSLRRIRRLVVVEPGMSA